MFDIEQSIAEWRRQMAAAGVKSPVPLDELESHLREETDRQAQLGLSLETAFKFAVGKIGPADTLRMEFGKINGEDKRRRQRRLAGIMYAVILGFYAIAAVRIIFKSDLTYNERLAGLASVATMLALIYVAWRIAHRYFPVIASERCRTALGIAGGSSGAIWFVTFAYLILPRFNFTPAQLELAVLWAMLPVMLLSALAFLGLDKNESGQSAKS